MRGGRSAFSPTGSITDEEILNEIADAETIGTCGLNAKPLIIYNKPSFEAYQPTSFYRPEVRRSSYIREYAYRCLY